MMICRITAADTLPLRQLVLWPDHPIQASQVTGDAAALHFGCFARGQLISVASLFPQEDSIRLRKFATHPNHQGQGVGSRMIRHLLTQAQARGHGRFWFDARETALPFYARFGFKPEGVRFFKRDLPYVRMARTL